MKYLNYNLFLLHYQSSTDRYWPMAHTFKHLSVRGDRNESDVNKMTIQDNNWRGAPVWRIIDTRANGVQMHTLLEKLQLSTLKN